MITALLLVLFVIWFCGFIVIASAVFGDQTSTLDPLRGVEPGRWILGIAVGVLVAFLWPVALIFIALKVEITR